MRSPNKVVLAYSGGLDTSVIIPWLKETYKRPVVTVTVNCGGIDAAAAKQLEERAKARGMNEYRNRRGEQMSWTGLYDRISKSGVLADEEALFDDVIRSSGVAGKP